jgi:hypothetical protein
MMEGNGIYLLMNTNELIFSNNGTNKIRICS